MAGGLHAPVGGVAQLPGPGDVAGAGGQSSERVEREDLDVGRVVAAGIGEGPEQAPLGVGNTRRGVHRRHRAPVLDHRCGQCGRVFNAFTGTILHGTRRRPSELALIVRGIAQGVPTARLARELNCDRSELLRLRHRLQDAAYRNRDRMPLDDPVLEADEAYQNAGEKRVSRTATPTTRRVGVATRPAAMAAGTTTGRRSAGWSGGRAARSG